MSVVFVNTEKCSVENRVVFIKPLTYLTRFDSVNLRQNDFVKTVNFCIFLVLMAFRYDFYDDFCFEFHLNPLTGAIQAS